MNDCADYTRFEHKTPADPELAYRGDARSCGDGTEPHGLVVSTAHQ